MSDRTLYANHFLTWTPVHTSINDGGTWRLVATYENNGGTWRCVQSPMSVTCADLNKISSGPSACGAVQSNNANPVVSNGISPFTYSWAHVSTSQGNTPTISNASSATPTFSATACDGAPSVSTWRLTVTEDTAATSQVTITVTLDWIDTS